jgi:purine-binding chemotaxis protein CheW
LSTYVRLRVAAEAYAIPVTQVRGVSDLDQVTPVPGSPPGVLGLCNLRGQLVPVIDLAVILGISRVGAPGYLLVAQSHEEQAALAIDAVSGVSELPDQEEEVESGMLSGAVLDGGDLIGVIDVPAVFGAVERVPR